MRPSDETALIRIVASGYGNVLVELADPVTGDPIKGRAFNAHDHSPWLSIPAESGCFRARARSQECPGIVEFISKIKHGSSCRGLGPWAEQDICFDPQSRGKYEVEVRSRKKEICWKETELLGFWLVGADTRDLVREYPIDNYCKHR